MHNQIKIFAGMAGRGLAADVCRSLNMPLGEATVGRFSDGEPRIQILEDVRDKDVFIINPTHPPAENFFDMALLTDAARRSLAGRITIVPVYLGCNRQDRKDRPRVPISAAVVIRLLSESGANHALLFDLHSEPTAGFFGPSVTVDHLYASTVSLPYLNNILTRPYVIASPDKGGGPRAEAYARRLGQADFVLFSKIRQKSGDVMASSIKIIGDIAGRDVVFVDDMIDTGGTLIADAQAAKQAGANNVYAYATHALFSGNAIARLDESCIDEVIVTDTIPHSPELLATKRVKITVLSMAQFIGEAIRRIHQGESLSALITN
jgi:ribose-phosphate pyrophosphokinase